MNIKQKLALIRVMLYFNAILRKGKISKAAEENGIKQGNLSHLITDFEKSSGILLLQRKKPCIPNRAEASNSVWRRI